MRRGRGEVTSCQRDRLGRARRRGLERRGPVLLGPFSQFRRRAACPVDLAVAQGDVNRGGKQAGPAERITGDLGQRRLWPAVPREPDGAGLLARGPDGRSPLQRAAEVAHVETGAEGAAVGDASGEDAELAGAGARHGLVEQVQAASSVSLANECEPFEGESEGDEIGVAEALADAKPSLALAMAATRSPELS